MLPKYLFYLAFGTLLISGCGLDTDDDEDEESSYVEVSVEQSIYLPLTNGTQFFYTATGGTVSGLEANISYDVGMSNQKGYPVHKVAIDGDDLSLDLYFRTTTNQIELIGIDGPVDVSGASIDYLRFNTPIKLIGNRSDQSTKATAAIEINGGSLSNSSITLDYDVSNSSNSAFNNDTTLNGDVWRFPTLNATLEAEITVTATGLSIDPIPITLEFYFTKGLGLVQHSGNLTENTSPDYEVKFDHLLELPNVMVFDTNGDGPSSHFTMADSGDNLSSADFSVVNQSELNALSWLTVSTDTNGDWRIIIEHDDTMPNDLTSYQVLFENKRSDERLSANITILEP
ncbi:MAG: hypothetical protein VYA55_05705 [Pseudomonadota bacterium]|nr:hypothetical protein [Pseudomonadota bacterium]